MRLFKKRRDREQASKASLDQALSQVQQASNVFDGLREMLRKIQVDVHAEEEHHRATPTGSQANAEQRPEESGRRTE